MIQLNYLFVTLWVVVYGKIEIVFDGDMENCGEGRNFDFSNLDFIPYNDTHIFLNGLLLNTYYLYHQLQSVFSFQGSFTFITEVRPPWYLRAAFEKFQNGKWQQSKLNRKIPDFCSVVTMFFVIQTINCI